MNSKSFMGGLAGLSILILSGCSTAPHTATQNETTNQAAQSNVTSNIATTTTPSTTSSSSLTTTPSSNTSSTASSTNAATTNSTSNATGTATNATTSTTASTATNSGSANNTVSVTTQPGTLQNSMAASIQTLLTNPAKQPVDCSALVEYVYQQSSINLPRTVSEQSKVGTRISSENQLQYGDIVFFDLSTQPNTPTFDGIYVGNGQFVAKTTHGIMSMKLNSSYWGNKFLYGQHVN